MKKFSELKIGDRIFIYVKRSKELPCFSTHVKNIIKIKKFLILETSWTNFVINNIEEDFCITEADFNGILEAISTSMDRLLLECEE